MRRGTVIYGSARGVQIGRVLEHEIVRERHELEAGRVRVAFYASPFGFVDAWVTEEDVRLAKELEAAERRDAERITFQSFVVKGDLGDAREAVTERRLELARCMRTGSAAAPRDGAFRATVLLTPDGLTESVVVSDLGAGLREVQGFRECAETALRETAWPRPTRPAKTAGSIRFSARLTPQKP